MVNGIFRDVDGFKVVVGDRTLVFPDATKYVEVFDDGTALLHRTDAEILRSDIKNPHVKGIIDKAKRIEE